MAITLRNTKGIALTHNELDGNFTDLNDRTTCLESCASNSITSTQIDNWDCAYGWGDHSQAGYCTTETSHADVVVDGDFTCAGLMTTDGNGAYTVTTDNSANWDCAYGWGDHSQAGYTCYSNTDVDGHLNQANPTGGYVLSWNGNDYEWVAQSGGGSTNSIAQDDTNVTVTDTGTDGHIDFQTENTVRWTVNCSGHIVPNGNACYDIGEAENKVRHFYLSQNSLKFVEDGTNTEYPLGVTGGQLFFNGEQVSGGGGGGTADNSITWTLTNNSTINWVFNGPGIETGNTNDPELQLIRGYTYKFNNTVAISHPFEIRTEDGGSAYTAGISKVGDVTTFTVPYDAPDVLVYQCTSHATMLGTIKIVNANNSLQSRTNLQASAFQVPGVQLGRDITGFKGYNLYKITTNIAARVIVYTSAAARTADAGRAEGIDPASDAGVIAEVVTTGAETITLSPGVIGYNNEDPVTNIIPIYVTNKTGSPATTTVTLTVVQTEA